MKQSFTFSIAGLILFAVFQLAKAEPADTFPAKKNIVFYASFNKTKQPEFNKFKTPIKWHGVAGIKNEQSLTGKGAMRLGIGGYGEIDKQTINVTSGTIGFWFKPVGDPVGDSHTYISWGWESKGYPYMVFSKGWFENDPSAGGKDLTYYIFNIKNGVLTADRTNLRVGEWTFYTISWDTTPKGKFLIKLYQNGKESISRLCSFPKGSQVKTPIYLGGDVAVVNSKKRWADGFFNDFIIYNKALSDYQVKELFNVKAKSPLVKKSYLHNPASWMEKFSNKKPREKRDKKGNLLESRVIFAEGTLFQYYSKAKMKKALDRIQYAGFNVYKPMPWHGGGMQCESGVVKLKKRYKKFKENNPGRDSYKELVDEIHKRGMEIHPSFTIMLARPNCLPQFKLKGTRFFNGYDPKFRNIIVKIVLDHVKRYNVDGIDLDYVRLPAIGIDTLIAEREYKRIYGRDLTKDRKNRDRMAKFTGHCVNDIVKRISEGARKIRPKIIISISSHIQPKSWGLPANGRNNSLWIEKGWIDIAYNMDYKQRLGIELMDKVRAESKKPYANVELIGNYDYRNGKVVPRNGKLLADIVDFCRRKYNDGNGIGIYLLKQLTDAQIKALRKGPFKELAKPSWRSK